MSLFLPFQKYVPLACRYHIGFSPCTN